jgi:hypothetical protein
LTLKKCITKFVFMKNITITLPDQVARWARVWAARNERSLSGMISNLVRQQMQLEDDYEQAMRNYLAEPPLKLKKKGRYPSRDEIHDRDALR